MWLVMIGVSMAVWSADGVCSGRTCFVCPGHGDDWMFRSVGGTLSRIEVRGACNSNTASENGTVTVSVTPRQGVTRPTLTGVVVVGDGQTILSGECPLYRLTEKSLAKNLRLHCTNPPHAAIEIVGPDVAISNVIVTGGSPVFDAAAASEVINIEGLTISDVESVGGPTDDVVGVIGNAFGTTNTLACSSPQYIVSQPLSGLKLGPRTKCEVVDIGELLGFYGTEYEIDYYTKYGGDTGLGGVYSQIIWIEAVAIVVGVCAMIVFHQDTAYLIGLSGAFNRKNE